MPYYLKPFTWQVAFLNITGFRDDPLADMPMLEVRMFKNV
jgi:hypothetical protein